MDWSSRHYSTLIELRAKVLCDIEGFIPEGYFTKKKIKISLEGFARFGGTLAKDNAHTDENKPDTPKTWGEYAVKLGNELLHNPQKSILTFRQLAASRLLMYLGHHFLKPTSYTDDLCDSITSYFKYLSKKEKRQFHSLLVNEPEQPKPEVKSIGRHIQQEDEILRIIREELGLDPQNLPPRHNSGIAGTKKAVRENLTIPSTLFCSHRVFGKAWERLMDKKLIKYRPQ